MRGEDVSPVVTDTNLHSTCSGMLDRIYFSAILLNLLRASHCTRYKKKISINIGVCSFIPRVASMFRELHLTVCVGVL